MIEQAVALFLFCAAWAAVAVFCSWQLRSDVLDYPDNRAVQISYRLVLAAAGCFLIAGVVNPLSIAFSGDVTDLADLFFYLTMGLGFAGFGAYLLGLEAGFRAEKAAEAIASN